MEHHAPYPVIVYAGTRPNVDGVRLIDVTPADSTAAAALAALRTSGITPSDLRNRMLFLTDLPAAEAVVVAVAVFGFAGRRIDCGVGTEVLRGPKLDSTARALPDSGRPATPVLLAQFGAVRDDIASVAGFTDPDAVATIRYAKRLRYVPAAETLAALTETLVIGGIRAKGTLDRLPFLVTGDEPVGDDPLTAVGICLDTLKRDAATLRRTLRFDDRSAVAETEAPTERDLRLAAVAALDITAVLDRLDARRADETGTLWHCPRPANHAHGDANPGFRVDANRGLCLRCDVEALDPLRLTMAVRGVTADEAATWLLAK